MLSVRYRDEDRGLDKDRRAELGLVGAHKMEENELEEGEACSYRDMDSDVHNPDGDIDLSYIDEKIRNVLGHFQKNFEGGVCAENLGATFGGYGSFLQRPRSPPIASHPGSSVRVQHPVMQSHVDQSFVSQGSRQSITHQTITPVPTPATQALVNSHMITSARFNADIGKELRANTTVRNSEESPRKGGSTMEPSSCNAKKSLKVKFKVHACPAATSNKEDIYNCLGLDVSPLSSPEESSGCIIASSPETQEAPDESPTTILQFMTSSPIPEDLLSPLSDSLLRLLAKSNLLKSDARSCGGQKGSLDAALVRGALPGNDFMVPKVGTVRVVGSPVNPTGVNHLNAMAEKGISASVKKERHIDASVCYTSNISLPVEVKTTKAVEKAGKPGEVRNLRHETDSPLVKKKMVVDAPESKELGLESLKYSLPSRKNNLVGNLGMQSTGDLRKNACKLTDLFGEDEDTSILQSTSDNVKVETKEITSTLRSDQSDEAKQNSVPMKARLTLKTDLAEKSWLDQEFHDKDTAKLSRDTNAKVDAKSNASGDIGRGKKNNEPLKPKIVKNKLTSNSGGKKGKEEKGHFSGEKMRQNGVHGTAKSTSESSKERSRTASSGSHKHKKKGMTATVDAIEAHPDLMRLQEPDRRATEDYHNDPTLDIKTEHVKGRLPFDSMGSSVKDTNLSNSGHNAIEPCEISGKPIEKLDIKASQSASVSDLNGEGGHAATMPAKGLACETIGATTSVLITENWVCCDKCQKWRLLPYGPENASLPKKWVCRMQSWLPAGLNKCSISQEEGNKAFYALYQIQDHQNPSHNQSAGIFPVTSLTGGQNRQADLLLSASISSGTGKKHLTKETLNDSSFVVDSSFPNSTKKSLPSFVKCDSLNDASQRPLDSNPLDKDRLWNVAKAEGHDKEKRKHKHIGKRKSLGGHSDGGSESMEQDSNSKSQSKRELLQSDHRAPKKIKVDRSVKTGEEHNLNNELMGSTSNGTKWNDQKSLKHNEYCSSSKDSKCGDMENDDNLGKIQKDRNHSSLNGESKVKPDTVGVGKLDKNEIATKKRKMNEWQENREIGKSLIDKWPCSDVIPQKRTWLHESEHRNEKKVKSSKCEGRVSNTSNGKMDKKAAAVMKIAPYSDGDLVMGEPNEVRNGMHEKKQNIRVLPRNSVSRTSEGANHLKLEAGCTQHSAVATSSSSKISGSRNTKINVLEVKGSPVESVSSSPVRQTNGDKVVPRKNSLEIDDLINEGHGSGSGLHRSPDGEIDGARKDRNSSAIECIMQDDYKVNKSSLDARRKKCDVRSIDRNHINMGIAPNSGDCRNNGGSNGTDEPEWQNQLVSGTKIKGSSLKRNNDTLDVPVQLKATKGSTSLSKNKQWTNKLEPRKGKPKVHDSFDENPAEFYSRKNEETGNGCPSLHEEEPVLHTKGALKPDVAFNNDVQMDVRYSIKKSRDVQLIAKTRDKLDTEGSPIVKTQIGSMVGKSESVSSKDGKSLHSNAQDLTTGLDKKFMAQNLSNRMNQKILVSGRGNTQSLPASRSKQQGQRETPPLHAVSKLEVVDVPNGAAEKLHKQSRQPDDMSVAVNVSLRHSVVNSVINKEPDSVRNMLREATNVKHSADRLKSIGQERESVGLYFSAALKFLHAASLSEPSDAEVSRQGDNSSIKVYVDTANLCKFCAHMYEKHKDMAAATLAYKCMEVAFMRVIFLKHSYANSIRQGLQALIPNVVGESPSSSASDVDNLNNAGMPDRPRQVLGVCSPQIPTSLVISGSSRRSIDWLLNLANDVNSAMDALRRSQNAFAAATGSSENVQYRPEGISSVKRVIEFNFHNVEELLHLVRSSLEEISH